MLYFNIMCALNKIIIDEYYDEPNRKIILLDRYRDQYHWQLPDDEIDLLSRQYTNYNDFEDQIYLKYQNRNTITAIPWQWSIVIIAGIFSLYGLSYYTMAQEQKRKDKRKAKKRRDFEKKLVKMTPKERARELEAERERKILKKERKLAAEERKKEQAIADQERWAEVRRQRRIEEAKIAAAAEAARQEVRIAAAAEVIRRQEEDDDSLIMVGRRRPRRRRRTTITFRA